MQKRESYLYVGMDLHKKTHTAVLVNCWNEKIETLVIENKPVEFEKLMKRVNRKALTLGLTPVYGLENVYGHGRSLAVFLLEKGCVVKDVNPALAYDRRRSAPTMKGFPKSHTRLFTLLETLQHCKYLKYIDTAPETKSLRRCVYMPPV